MQETTINYITKHLNGKSEIELLDIGCRRAEIIFELLADTDINFKKIVAVDWKIDPCYDGGISLKDNYLVGRDDEKNWNRVQDVEMSFRKENGIDYLTKEKSKYDLIIFSLYLNYFEIEDIYKQIDLALTLLKTNGSVYISMQNENYSRETIPDLITSLDDGIEIELRSKYNVIDFYKGSYISKFMLKFIPE